MIKKFSYSVVDNSEILFSEELINEHKLTEEKRVFEGDSVHETLTKYNIDKKILSETELENGVELNRLEFSYDEKGRITEERMYMSDEIYQKKTAAYTDSGYTKSTFQDEEEVEREVKVLDGKNYRIDYLENGKLDQYQICEFDDSGLNSILKSFEPDGRLIGEDYEYFNENGKLLGTKELSGNGNLINETSFKLEGDLYIEEIVKDYSAGNSSSNVLIRSIEYDNRGNQIKIDVKSPDGNLLGFHIMEYDDLNRLILEKGLSLGSFNAIYGTQVNKNSFHFVYKYEEQN